MQDENFMDSLSPQIRNKWQSRATNFLNMVRTININANDGLSNITDENCKNPPKTQEIYYKLINCLKIKELESIIDEAELHDIYNQNEEYDILVDHHIKAQAVQKQAKKLLENRRNPNLKKYNDLLVKIVKNGIHFKEAQELMVIMDLYKRCFVAKNQKVSLDTISDLCYELQSNSDIVEDRNLIDQINNRKETFEAIKEKILMFGSPTRLSEMDDSLLKPLIQEIKKLKMDYEELPRLEALIQISVTFRKLNDILCDTNESESVKKIDTVYYENISKLTQLKDRFDLDTENFLRTFDQDSERRCEKAILGIEEIISIVDLEDPIEDFVVRFKNFTWIVKATRLINNNSSSFELIKELEDCVDSVPEKLKEISTEYSFLQERVHCIKTAKQKEEKIKKNLEKHWKLSIEELMQMKDKVLEFLADVEVFFGSKHLDRQIEVLDSIIKCFGRENLRLVELHALTQQIMALGDERLFLEISVIAANSEKATMYKNELTISRNKIKKLKDFINNNKKTTIVPLRDVLDLPRKDLGKSKQIMKYFESLSIWIKNQFLSEIHYIQDSQENLEKCHQQMQFFTKKFPISNLLQNSIDIENLNEAIELYNIQLENYFNCDIIDTDFENKLEKYHTVLKAIILCADVNLIKSDFGSFQIRRDISSWETTIDKIKKLEENISKDCYICTEQESKMKSAEKLLMEAHKMRQFENQCNKGGMEAQNRQYRMQTIEMLKTYIKDYETGTLRIELQGTISYLKKIHDNVVQDLEKIDGWLIFEDLETLRNNLQKYPVFISNEIYSKINARAQLAIEFKNEINGLICSNPKKIYKELESFNKKYESLKLEIKEFESCRVAIKRELEYENTTVKPLIFEANQESYFTDKIFSNKNKDDFGASENMLTERYNSMSLENELNIRISGNQSDINNSEIQNEVYLSNKKPNSQQKLDKIKQVREIYNQHIYVINDEYSLGVLNREIELIQTEYEKRLFEENDAESNYEFDEDNKVMSPILDLQRCEELLEESKRSFQYGGSDSIKNHSFIKKLVMDIKKFIEEKLLASTSIEELNSTLECNPFSDIVDLTKEISERKKYLESNSNMVVNYNIRHINESAYKNPQTYPPIEYDPFNSVTEKEQSIRQKYKNPVPYGYSQKPNKFLSSKLRQTYVSTLQTLINQNPVFSIPQHKLNIEATAEGIEREMMKKCLESWNGNDEKDFQKKSEVYYKQICFVFQKILNYKFMSNKLKDKNFKLNLTEQLFTKSKEEFEELETSLFQKEIKKQNSNTKNINAASDFYNTDSYLDKAYNSIKKMKFEQNLEQSFVTILNPTSDQKIQDKNEVTIEIDGNRKNSSCTKSKKINFYKVFNGCLHFKIGSTKETKKADKTELFTCNNVDQIRNFAAISSKLQLSMKISFDEFEKYIQKCEMLSEEYSILPGWLKMKSTSTKNACKNYLEKHEIVASSQYSKKCKIFIFSKAQISMSEYFANFLKNNNFYIAKEENESLDQLFILIQKTSESNYEVPMYPESENVDTRKFNFYHLLPINIQEKESKFSTISEVLIDPNTLFEECTSKILGKNSTNEKIGKEIEDNLEFIDSLSIEKATKSVSEDEWTSTVPVK